MKNLNPGMVAELAISVRGWQLVTDWSKGLLTGQPIVLAVLQASEEIYFKKNKVSSSWGSTSKVAFCPLHTCTHTCTYIHTINSTSCTHIPKNLHISNYNFHF